ncbi:MAG: PAS domain-containing protein [Phycisphaerales bacterium]|nr:MAG: PAS domain-containing protein [Phycisphaerales bacterium]
MHSPKSRFLIRGESIIASWGLILAAILLLAMGASAWWTSRTHRLAVQEAGDKQAETLGTLLQRSGETLLAADELSALRCLLADAARSDSVNACRILLPDGRVIADSDPSEIELTELPDRWEPNANVIAESTESAGDGGVRRYGLVVPGRGEAQLELVQGMPADSAGYFDMLTGIGLIGATALLGVLFAYRHLRARLGGLTAIRGALLAWTRGETAESVLAVSSSFGDEAAAWNSLLQQLSTARESTLKEQAAELLQSRSTGMTDLATAYDALWDGILIVSDDYRIECTNGAAAVMLRSSREDLIDGDVRSLLPAAAAEPINAVLSSSSGARSTVEVEMGDGDSEGVLRFSVRPMKRDGRLQALVVIEDITQQRVANEAQHSFMDQVVHELRTPLTNIRLSVDMAIEAGEEDSATRAESINVINGEARRLERVVSDMLTVAEIEAGSMRLRTDDVDLAGLLSELEREYQIHAAEKTISLQFNLPPKLPTIEGDRDKIALVLHNLIGNALKYTPEGGTVHVVVSSDQDHVMVEVRDTGIGIGDQDAERIFERFYRANDPRIASITGTGLGLALAREVVRLHGGDITVESVLDEGTTFAATIPVNKAA